MQYYLTCLVVIKKAHNLSLIDFILHCEINLYSEANINLFIFVASHFCVKILPCPSSHTNNWEKEEHNLLSVELITVKTSSCEVVKFTPMSSATKCFETQKHGTSVNSVHYLILSENRNKPYFVSKWHNALSEACIRNGGNLSQRNHSLESRGSRTQTNYSQGEELNHSSEIRHILLWVWNAL